MDGSKWMPVKSGSDCSSVTDYEGNTYTAADFGAAGCWMTQNLRSTKRSATETLTENINSNNENVAYYYYPNADPTILSSHPEYGLLYTWAAANYGASATESSDAFPNTASTRQGICPVGWHLPSYYEWTQLEEEIAKSAAGIYSSTAATTWDDSYYENLIPRGEHGHKMKSSRTIDERGVSGVSHARTANGFDALCVGHVINGSAHNFGNAVDFWQSSSCDASHGSSLFIMRSSAYVGISNSGKYKLESVRCKKN